MKLFVMILIFLTTTFCIIADHAAFSQAGHIASQPQTHAIESFNQRKIISWDDDEEDGCTYTFTIKTSCSSPSSTTDQIICLFGDATGNKLQGALDDPDSSARFSPCSTVEVTLKTNSQCLKQICLLYLTRSGIDGWIPENVTIESPNSGPFKVIFDNNTSFLPEGISVGANMC